MAFLELRPNNVVLGSCPTSSLQTVCCPSKIKVRMCCLDSPSCVCVYSEALWLQSEALWVKRGHQSAQLEELKRSLEQWSDVTSSLRDEAKLQCMYLIMWNSWALVELLYGLCQNLKYILYLLITVFLIQFYYSGLIWRTTDTLWWQTFDCDNRRIPVVNNSN